MPEMPAPTIRTSKCSAAFEDDAARTAVMTFMVYFFPLFFYRFLLAEAGPDPRSWHPIGASDKTTWINPFGFHKPAPHCRAVCRIQSRYSVSGVTPVRPPQPAAPFAPVD